MRFLTIVLVTIPLLGLSILDYSLEHRPWRTTNDSIAVALAGEFRTVIANLLWIKADNYHHEYVAHHGDWTKNEDALGLDQMITKLDPHFEEAYATGAKMLIGLGRPRDARKYLEEGVNNNPNSMMLNDELGTLLARHLKDYKGALFHLNRAYILATDDWDRRRLHKLIGSVERLAKPESSSTSPS